MYARCMVANVILISRLHRKQFLRPPQCDKLAPRKGDLEARMSGLRIHNIGTSYLLQAGMEARLSTAVSGAGVGQDQRINALR